MDTTYKASVIVDHIIQNLSDRSGIGNEWYQIEYDIQLEIRKEWEDIVKKEIEK